MHVGKRSSRAAERVSGIWFWAVQSRRDGERPWLAPMLWRWKPTVWLAHAHYRRVSKEPALERTYDAQYESNDGDGPGGHGDVSLAVHTDVSRSVHTDVSRSGHTDVSQSRLDVHQFRELLDGNRSKVTNLNALRCLHLLLTISGHSNSHGERECSPLNSTLHRSQIHHF